MTEASVIELTRQAWSIVRYRSYMNDSIITSIQMLSYSLFLTDRDEKDESHLQRYRTVY